MAFLPDENAIGELFNSRGAQIYWDNWNKLTHWYSTYMMPVMAKCDAKIQREVQCGENSDQRHDKHIRRRRKKREKGNKYSKKCSSFSQAQNSKRNEEEDLSKDEPVSSEFLEFSQITLQHRLDLKKMREDQGIDENIEYAADDEGPEEKPTPSSDPPDVQAGSARTNELKLLYGSNALQIQSLETQLQAKFDENRTRLQPKLWPVIPLNL
ncbi:uncharacterized protein LOC120328568 [Styela clava]